MRIRGSILSPRHTRWGAALVLGLLVCLWPAGWRLALPALSPFVAICSPVAMRTLSAAALLSLPVLLAVVLHRRFWCRHLCPVGLISEYCGRVRPRRRARAARLPWPPARFLALATLGGAMLGYPLFLWMDPLALFSGFFNVTRGPRAGLLLLSAAGLPAVMLISILFPGTWCGRICPLGGTQDLIALAVLRLRRARQANRRGWGGVAAPARRVFLAAGTGTVVSAFVPKSWAKTPRHLRPPGSVGEIAFKGDCIRCGSCTRVCPTGIIEPVVDAGDVAGFLAPRLRFSGINYCLQDCNRCGKACPTGVIRPLELAEKNRHVIGIASIDLSECLLARDVECGVCIPRCPRGAIEEVFNQATYQTTLRVLREKCNGCGACVGICPPKVVTVVPPGQ